MSVTYGISVQTPEDVVSGYALLCFLHPSTSPQYISDAEETMEMIGKATMPGAFLVDIIPTRTLSIIFSLFRSSNTI